MQLTTLANAQTMIRPFEPADADEFVRAAHESIDTVGRWMSWCTPSFNREQALAWFASCDQDRAAGRAFDMGIFCATTVLYKALTHHAGIWMPLITARRTSVTARAVG